MDVGGTKCNVPLGGPPSGVPAIPFFAIPVVFRTRSESFLPYQSCHWQPPICGCMSAAPPSVKRHSNKFLKRGKREAHSAWDLAPRNL